MDTEKVYTLERNLRTGEHNERRKWQATKTSLWLLVMHGGCVDLC